MCDACAGPPKAAASRARGIGQYAAVSLEAGIGGFVQQALAKGGTVGYAIAVLWQRPDSAPVHGKTPTSSKSTAAEATNPVTRRGSGMRHIAPAAAAAARPALRKRGLAAAGVLADWHKIVGPFLAGATAPEKLTPGRALPDGGRDAGVLHLRVGSPALAPEIAHLAPQIIEKVNGYFGYRAVARLHILHAPVARADTGPESACTARRHAGCERSRASRNRWDRGRHASERATAARRRRLRRGRIAADARRQLHACHKSGAIGRQ